MHAKIGSVSSDTMRAEGLLPCLLSTLEELDPKRAEELRKEVPEEAWEDDYHPFWYSEDASYLVEELFDALDEYAPPFCYFGAVEGDGADYGFWIDWDAFEEAVADEEVLKVDEMPGSVPEGYGYIAVVNGHGNVTLYRSEDGKLEEVWSVA